MDTLPPQKGPAYYNQLKEKYKKFVSGNELLLMPSILETVNTRTISLLTTDIKTHKLIGVNREIMEEALKKTNYWGQKFSPKK